MKYKELLQNKKLNSIIIFLCGMILIIFVWLFGSERWNNQETIESYHAKLKDDPSSCFLLYNLANQYYREKQYNKAIVNYEEVLKSPDQNESIVKKTIYNLGNAYYKLAEQEKDLNQGIKSLTQSIKYYRDAIPIADAEYNFTIARKKLKIMLDKLHQQQKQQQLQKETYALIQELLEKEKNIQNQLKKITKQLNAQEKIAIKNQLIEQRAENLKNLEILKQKIQQVVPKTQSKPNRTISGGKTI